MAAAVWAGAAFMAAGAAWAAEAMVAEAMGDDEGS
jgi:hypothetical protein